MSELRAVIYARYSSSSQREESIEGQIRDCTAYAERNGYMVIGTYADRTISGTTENRPEFLKMIKDSKRKQFDLIIVWKLDRFARNRFVSAKYKHQLKQNGVRVISANETISEGADGILLESMLEGMAEWYSENLKENVVRGLSVNAEKCKWNGGTLPIGYIVDEEQRLQPNRLTAPYVVEAFKMYDEGHILTQLEESKEELLVRIAEEKLEKPKISAESMTFWLHRFRRLDVTKEAHRQMLIDTFVNAVFVHVDKLLLIFNFKEGTRTITLDDVKTATCSSGSDLDCCATGLEQSNASVQWTLAPCGLDRMDSLISAPQGQKCHESRQRHTMLLFQDFFR